VIAILVNRGSIIFIAVMFALLLGLVCAWLLARLSGIQRSTAFFCMAIGGASEMAAQAARHHARVDYVAAAHSLRLMLVVAIIPFALKFFDVHGQDAYEPATRIIQPLGLILLIGLTTCAALVLQKLRWPNAWVIGPLLVSVAITAANISLSALPTWMSHAGQLFIGFSLGTHFTPSFIRGAPRFMLSVAVCTIFALIVSAGFGWLLAEYCDLHFATAILATAPGGIAEMSLTAKTLELGVPIVTAFHVSRMAVLVLTIGPLFRLLQKFLSTTH
jgi:membrane AbrB-like protein